MSDREQAWREVLRARGVEMPCAKCQGLGVRAYSSTATWHGGMGGCMMTTDVCDECWGSGDAHRHGLDLRKMRATEDERVAQRAEGLIRDAVGGSGSLSLALLEVARHLDLLARKRKHADRWTPRVAEWLARVLCEMATASEVKP